MDASTDIATGFLLAAGVFWVSIACEVIIRAFRVVSEPEISDG